MHTNIYSLVVYAVGNPTPLCRQGLPSGQSAPTPPHSTPPYWPHWFPSLAPFSVSCSTLWSLSPLGSSLPWGTLPHKLQSRPSFQHRLGSTHPANTSALSISLQIPPAIMIDVTQPSLKDIALQAAFCYLTWAVLSLQTDHVTS